MNPKNALHGACVPYGLAILPAGLAPSDPRLPAIRLGPEKLRLNTHPLPATAMQGSIADHPVRLALLRAFLVSGSGAYAPRAAAFIDAYLTHLAAALQREHATLRAALAPYRGLYASEDFLWSALRPLPRAWPPPYTARADFAFWNGTTLIRFALTPSAPGIPATTQTLRDPDAFFTIHLGPPDWALAILPSSPFRRPPALTPASPASSAHG